MRRQTLIALPMLFFCLAAAPPPPKPVTAEEARAFVEKLAADMREDPSALAARFDHAKFEARAFEGLLLNAEQQASVRIKLRQGVGSVSKIITEHCQAGGSYRFLNIVSAEGRPQPILRFISSNGGLNYHRLLLEKKPSDASIRVADILVSTTGTHLSATIRQSLVPELAHVNRGLLDRLAGNESAYIKALPRIEAMIQSFQAGDHAGAAKQYQALPESVRDDKTVLMFYLQAAQRVDQTAYLKALERYETLHPNDPGLLLFKIDTHFLRKEYAKLRSTLDALDKAVGGDPYLDFYRGSACLAEGDQAKAKECWRKALARDPSLVAPYWSLIELALGAEEHAEVARLLTRIQTDAGVVLGDLAQAEVYKKFVDSPEGKKWIAEHPVKR